MMSRRQKNPLRPLTEEERNVLKQISRAQSEPASHVARARALLAVADGSSYEAAARLVGRCCGDVIAQWVARFNAEGLVALEPGHGGGPLISYGVAERERILAETRRPPDRERDGTATWSLMTLRRALRDDGLSHVSSYTIWRVLREAGWSWKKEASWCETGRVKRQRPAGVVEVIDPDATAKKLD
jgi:transposase